jgi:coatomer subunit beta
VRKYAVYAMYSIFILFPQLVPDTVEQICEFLENESDSECQYAAAYVLIHLNIDAAKKILDNFLEDYQSLEEFLQIISIDYFRKISLVDNEHSQLQTLDMDLAIRLLAESQFESSKFELITTVLNSVSSNHQVASELISFLLGILIKENNFLCQVLILKTLENFLEKFSAKNSTLCIEFLTLLHSQHYHIKNLAIRCSLKTFNPISSSEVLKRISDYLNKSESIFEDKLASSHLLEVCNFIFEVFKKISDHSLVVFSITQILFPLLKKIHLSDSEITNEILVTMRKILYMTSFTNIFEIPLIEFLCENPTILLNPKFLSIVLWVFGDPVSKSKNLATVQKILDNVKSLLIPLQTSTASKDPKSSSESLSNNILNRLHLYYLSLFLLKLVSTYSNTNEKNLFNKMKAECLILICELLKFTESSVELKSDLKHRELYDQIVRNMKLIVSVNDNSIQLGFDFNAIISKTQQTQSKEEYIPEISFGILDKVKCERPLVDKLEENLVLSKEETVVFKSSSDRFKNILQLSGSSDPIYVEAFVTIIKTDIIIDCLLVNQTEDTFYNLNLEFVLSGSMKMIESPNTISLLPHGFSFLKSVVRIPSSDSLLNINGVISYNLNAQNTAAEETIILSPVSPSIRNFIDKQRNLLINFSQLWTLLEWENKIDLPTTLKFQNLTQILEFLSQNANLRNISPIKLEDQDYIACNFIGSSVFGDDILVNACLERSPVGITGQIRLRSQSESIALIMGDYIQSLLV